MDAPIGDPTLPPGNVDAANSSPDDPSRSPDRLPGAVFARRLVLKAGGVNSPVRRSPRLSCLPPPQLPTESHDTQGLDSSSDDESDSVNDVALHLSRDETPDYDDIPSDEPSSVLANKIIRAHDNPSPPPQDLAHPGVKYTSGRDGQFPQPSVSIPPSPFRSINLLERLNQFSNPLFDHPRTQRTPSLGVRADMSEPSIISPSGSISPVPSITSAPMERNIHENVTSTDTAPSYLQRTVDAFPPQSSHHLLAIVNTLESEALISPPTQVVDPPRTPVILLASGGRPRGSLPHSEPQHSVGNSSLEESPSVDQNLPSLREGRETECKAARPKDVDTNSFQKQHYLSTPSAEALAKLDLPTKPTSSVEQRILPVEFIENQPATPPRPPTPSVIHPDFSRTSVQRPVITPTPVRANNHRKSPSKLLLEMDGVRRTPAQRIPIETVLACGNASLQRAVQLSTVQDQSRLGCFSTIRTPAFSRRALDDRSRSPAKRIPIADTAASPVRGHQTQCSPPRLAIRARSTSVEPRPSATTFARCRSVEPCTTTLRPDNRGKTRESIFPMVPAPPRAGTRLPFPLISVQKSNGDPPPQIPEEHENAETGNTRTDTMLARPMKGNTSSQLRQLVTSRIPRIGSKPYAKPQKNARTTARTTTGIAARAPKAPPFKLTCKNSGVGNSDAEVSSVQPTSDQPLMGSLKRKRGAEATAPPNLHPLIIRQVVPGVLSEKYAPKPVKLPSQARAPAELSPPKAPQPLKFRKVVDGMLSARYAPAKTTAPQIESPPSPLSDLSSLSDEGSPGETPTAGPSACPQSEMSDNPQVNANAPVAEPSNHELSPSRQDADGDKHSSRPRRTSRARKPAQQQYVIDVFSDNASTRPPPVRRKPLPRTDGDCFMGISATSLKALTTSNTTKNQQTVAVLATEVIRKEGLRPESPTVKARTILQKQRDERDVRRRERAQRRAKMSEEILGCGDGQQQSGLDDVATLATHEERDENDCDVQRKHRRGPGDEDDYETPERAVLEPLRLEGLDKKVEPMKRVKWHQGLSTAIYIDQVDPKPKFVPKNVVVRGCLAPTSKNLPLDSLGNLVDLEGRPFPELATEHIVVKRYLYDNDVEPEPIPPKVTRSRSKKSKA